MKETYITYRIYNYITMKMKLIIPILQTLNSKRLFTKSAEVSPGPCRLHVHCPCIIILSPFSLFYGTMVEHWTCLTDIFEFQGKYERSMSIRYDGMSHEVTESWIIMNHGCVMNDGYGLWAMVTMVMTTPWTCESELVIIRNLSP